jgi:hypothetical protein
MLLKSIFKNHFLFLTEIKNLKLLNNLYYNKFLIRNAFIKNKTLNFMENDFYNFHFSKKVLPINSHKQLQNLEGCSFSSKMFNYKNKFDNNLTFIGFNPQKTSFNYLQNFLEALTSISQLNNHKDNLIFFQKLLFIKVVKGGFICYSSGFFGFMPQSHTKKIKSFLNKKKKPRHYRSNLINYCKKTLIVIKEVFPFKVLKIDSIFPESLRKNFVLAFKKKRKFLRKVQKWNFIFLTVEKKNL